MIKTLRVVLLFTRTPRDQEDPQSKDYKATKEGTKRDRENIVGHWINACLNASCIIPIARLGATLINLPPLGINKASMGLFTSP